LDGQESTFDLHSAQGPIEVYAGDDIYNMNATKITEIDYVAGDSPHPFFPGTLLRGTGKLYESGAIPEQDSLDACSENRATRSAAANMLHQSIQGIHAMAKNTPVEFKVSAELDCLPKWVAEHIETEDSDSPTFMANLNAGDTYSFTHALRSRHAAHLKADTH
jgi:hypothetical protein